MSKFLKISVNQNIYLIPYPITEPKKLGAFTLKFQCDNMPFSTYKLINELMYDEKMFNDKYGYIISDKLPNADNISANEFKTEQFVCIDSNVIINKVIL